MLTVISAVLSACYHDHYYDDHNYVGPGPHGYDGEALLSIDYTVHHPYSYWDDNPDLPYNPEIGAFFHTYPGIYEFEYFINYSEYWYGTYEIWINPGGPGQPHGVPGYDGADNYFTLFCDPHGFWMALDQGYNKTDDGSLSIQKDIGDLSLRIVMKKANVNDRAAKTPKVIWNPIEVEVESVEK